MNKAQAQQFRNRWQVVEEIQQKESQAATIELRWQQLNALYCLSKSLKLSSHRSDEMQGYEQWVKLRKNASRSNRT